MWQHYLILTDPAEPSKHNTNDRDLFTFFNFCYRYGSSEYEDEFNKMWVKKVDQCSYLRRSVLTFPAQPTVTTLVMIPPAGKA
jgi:hypothetical protein